MTSNLNRIVADIMDQQRSRIEALEVENFNLRCAAIDMANELHPVSDAVDGLEHVTLSERKVA